MTILRSTIAALAAVAAVAVSGSAAHADRLHAPVAIIATQAHPGGPTPERMTVWLNGRAPGALGARAENRFVGDGFHGWIRHDAQTGSWYVLAEGQRRFELPIGSDQCVLAKKVWISGTTSQSVWTFDLAVRAGACDAP